ncbi:type II CAAX prenyl endopeptidase Rce1 family protein [Haloferax sp. DFSO52]|uniref:CPBP family glutamic-type intramembrane protease n=1 Tax=Haloferax sp. DFSO52 TaxID=3388505 RepID=UPI003A8A84CD
MSIVGVGADRYLRDIDDPRTDLFVSDISKWGVFALLCGYVVVVEGRPLSSLSGRSLDPPSFVAVVGGGVVVLLVANVVTAPLFDRVGVGGLGGELSQFGTLSRRHRLFVAFTAGVTEEALFHGYAIERLLEATGSPLLAGSVSFVAFTAGHALGWNRDAVVRIAVPALLTTVMYLLVRDVVALMAIHALNDAAGLLLVGSTTGTTAEGTTQ